MKRKGFSLIELMIVVAIIAVLASFAIPTYQAYIVKVRVGEGLHLAEVAKLAVADYVLTTHHLPDSGHEVHYPPLSSTENVSEIKIGQRGEISIIYTKQAESGTLTLIPRLDASGNLTWTCHLGTLDKKYAPSACH
jgi:type IV pilus assembly protein PilA